MHPPDLVYYPVCHKMRRAVPFATIQPSIDRLPAMQTDTQTLHTLVSEPKATAVCLNLAAGAAPLHAIHFQV